VASLNQGRIKRIQAELRCDAAVELEILEVMLRMGEVSRTRVECDTKLVRLALKALDRVITDYCARTGQRYPTYGVVASHLEERDGGTQAESPRVVSMQK
jgi:hypothetical protein